MWLLPTISASSSHSDFHLWACRWPPRWHWAKQMPPSSLPRRSLCWPWRPRHACHPHQSCPESFWVDVPWSEAQPQLCRHRLAPCQILRPSRSHAVRTPTTTLHPYWWLVSEEWHIALQGQILFDWAVCVPLTCPSAPRLVRSGTSTSPASASERHRR